MSQANDRRAPDGWTPDDGATVHLGRPHEPAADEPTAYLGGDATVHLGGDSTVRLGGDATVHLGGDATAQLGGDATVHAGDGATVRLGGAEPTTSLAPGQRTAGEPTVRLPAPGPTDERTVHLGGSESPTAAASQAPTAGATRPPGTGEPTAAVPIQWTTAAGRAAPAAGRAAAPGTWTTGVPGARTPGPPASGGEVRFGPGVPSAPPSAPAWPAAAPQPRRRPLWRRLASVLSTLLTVVLVAVVGLYLWQRLSPLEITDVTVAVPEPAGTRCDVTVDVVATVTTNGRAGEIRYQWLRSGSEPGSVLSERVGFGQRTARLTLRWSFSGVGSTAETATVNIIEPTPAQARAAVAYDCRG